MQSTRIHAATQVSNILDIARELSEALKAAEQKGYKTVCLPPHKIEAFTELLATSAIALQDILIDSLRAYDLADRRATVAGAVSLRNLMHRVWKKQATHAEFGEALQKFIRA